MVSYVALGKTLPPLDCCAYAVGKWCIRLGIEFPDIDLTLCSAPA